jgi:DNA-binding NarL/FixJ family response regulator
MSKTVLIAESNDVFLKVLTATLSLLGFDVVGQTSVKSEVEALALATRPDLLMFDFNLSSDSMAVIPDLKQIKEKLPEMKILVLGFYEATDEFAEVMLDAGFDGFWNKTDTRAGLIEKLNFLFP